MQDAVPPSVPEPPCFEVTTSGQFTAWMAEYISLVFPTYQTGKYKHFRIPYLVNSLSENRHVHTYQ